MLGKKNHSKMISLFEIVRRILAENMTFGDLLNQSDAKRAERSKHVHAKTLHSPERVASSEGDRIGEKPLRGVATEENDAWSFSYKSDPGWNTTGRRWHGYIKFLKEGVTDKEDLMGIDCLVDCTCPDYKYRWAYRNAEAGAGAIGADAWNTNNGNPPTTPQTDLGTGLCKHLIHLGEYLRKELEAPPAKVSAPQSVPTIQAPQPPKEPVKSPTPAKPSVPSKPTPTKQPAAPIAKAPQKPAPKLGQKPFVPKKPTPYSDKRAGGLEEDAKISLIEKLNNFVRSHSTFEVPCED